MSYVVGVDVGGTNTDTAILLGGKVVGKGKQPTTEDKTLGIVASLQSAINQLCNSSGGEKMEMSELLNSLARVAIGTTHFVNAVKKRDGQNLDRVAVIRLCGSSSRGLPPFSDFPEELKELMFGGAYMLDGGLDYDRSEISPVREEEVKAVVQQIVRSEPLVRRVVIAGVFAPCDEPCGSQERLVEKIVKETCPELSCTLSHELGMLGLLERENAAVLNESLKSLAQVTVRAFEKALVDMGIRCPFFLTQNDGTLITGEEAVKFPVLTFSSGPTNSMRGAAFLSKVFDGVVVDIGGTTTDVGVLKNGFPRISSTHYKVAGVRTNFSMPDVQSIALGGGSYVCWNKEESLVALGPGSVEYRLQQEALSFGGGTCTTTDIAVAAGLRRTHFCTCPEKVASLPAAMVYASMREIHRRLEVLIDSMKTNREDVPVVLVGGGCVLVDEKVPLKGSSCLKIPEDHWDIANAVGAALGTVGGVSDIIVPLGPIKDGLRAEGVCESELELLARQAAAERGRAAAKSAVLGKIKTACGCVSEELRAGVYIHTEEVADVAYVANRVHVKVKAIGALTSQDLQSSLPRTLGGVAGDSQPDGSKVVQVPFSAQDRPHWPYSSSEERTEDQKASLPPPKVVASADGCGWTEWILSELDVECLALGAGILGCGGGGDPNLGRIMALKLLKEGKQVKIFNPCRVDASEMGVVCGIGFMGAPSVLVEKLVGGEETFLALTRLRQLLASGAAEVGGAKVGNDKVRIIEKTCTYFDGSSFPTYMAEDADLKEVDLSSEDIPLSRRVTGLTCLEVGGMNSIEPIIVAAKTGLPLLDVDGMGRAFPELQMYIPFIYGASHCPSVLADNKGKILTCCHVNSAQELEKFFRVETVRMGMEAGLAMGVMDFSSMMSKTVLYTMSRAWQVGRAVLRARRLHSSVLAAITDLQEGFVLIYGKMVGVAREIEAGFTRVLCTVEGLEDYAGHQVRVQARNEFYIVHKVNPKGEELDLLACSPDLISMVDSTSGVPVTTEEVRYGLRVGVVILPASPVLKTPRALEVVGPRGFGFHVDYREPRPLI